MEGRPFSLKLGGVSACLCSENGASKEGREENRAREEIIKMEGEEIFFRCNRQERWEGGSRASWICSSVTAG